MYYFKKKILHTLCKKSDGMINNIKMMFPSCCEFTKFYEIYAALASTLIANLDSSFVEFQDRVVSSTIVTVTRCRQDGLRTNSGYKKRSQETKSCYLIFKSVHIIVAFTP